MHGHLRSSSGHLRTYTTFLKNLANVRGSQHMSAAYARPVADIEGRGRAPPNSVLKKVKEFYNKKRPSTGWSGVHLLHDNTSSHKCEVVKSFLASEKVKVLNRPPYSPNLSPCDFFLFPRLKKMLSGNKYRSRRSLCSAFYQCLQQIPKEDYLSAFRDWVKRLQKCVSVKGE